MQQAHAPLRSKLLQKQDEQREGEKLYGTDEGHAAVRPPEEPAQMEKNDGHGGKKRSAACRAEQSPAEQEKQQSQEQKEPDETQPEETEEGEGEASESKNHAERHAQRKAARRGGNPKK